MELKHGYKQSEVGVIPEDWEISTVGQEFEIKLGKMLDADKNVGVKKFYLGNKSVQWDSIDITNLSTMAMTPDDLNRFRLQKGDLLVCEGGEIGRCAIWNAPMKECYYQKALHRLRPSGKFEPRLMMEFFRHWTQEGLLTNYVTQTSIAHLTREKLATVPLLVPPLPEQSTIATALGDVAALIAALDALIAKKRDLKLAAMQQLLTGKQRLPGFNGEWEMKELGDVVTIISGGTPSTGIDSYWNGEIKWCVPTDITSNSSKYLYQTERTISASGLASCSARLLPIGTLLLCSRATIGEVKIAATEVCTNQGFKSLICRDKVNNEFLYYLLLTMKPELIEKCSGSTFLEISKKDTASLEIFIPPIEEQIVIAEVLSDMDAELAALEAKRDKTRDLKRGMMQELLTGRTRLMPTNSNSLT